MTGSGKTGGKDVLPPLDDAARSVIEDFRKAMTPATRTHGVRYFRALFFIVALGVATVLIPFAAAALFLFSNADNAAPILSKEIVETIVKDEEQDLKDLAQYCQTNVCTMTQLNAAATARDRLETIAADSSNRKTALKTYSTRVRLLIGFSFCAVVFLAILVAQSRITFRFWAGLIEGDRSDYKRDPTDYHLKTRLPPKTFWQVAFGFLALIVGLDVLLREVTETQPRILIVLVTILVLPFVLSALFFKDDLPERRKVKLTPGLVLGLSGAFALVASELALFLFPAHEQYGEVLSPWIYLGVVCVSAVLAMMVAISLFAVKIYSENYPRPSKVEELPERINGLNSLVTAYSEADEKAKSDGVPIQPRSIASGKVLGTIVAYDWWDSLRYYFKEFYVDDPTHAAKLTRLQISAAYTPTDLKDDVSKLTTTLAVAFVLALTAMGVFMTDVVARIGDGGSALDEERNKALGSFLMFVGFGYSAILAWIHLTAQTRLTPYVSAEEALKEQKDTAPKAMDPGPWILEETGGTSGDRTITPKHPFKDPEWENRKKEADDAIEERKKIEADLENATPKFTDYTGCSEEKLAIIMKSTEFGGSLQDILHGGAGEKMQKALTLVAPAAASSLYAIFG